MHQPPLLGANLIVSLGFEEVLRRASAASVQRLTISGRFMQFLRLDPAASDQRYIVSLRFE